MTKTAASPELWPGMSVDQHQAIADYITTVLPILELRDWTVALDRHPLPEDTTAYAEISVIPGQKRANITLCRDWPTIEPDKYRRLIAHELIHCHLDTPAHYLDDVLNELVGRPATLAILTTVRERIELAVDALAEAVVPLLPDAPA
jgi:hypothetical protein